MKKEISYCDHIMEYFGTKEMFDFIHCSQGWISPNTPLKSNYKLWPCFIT